MRRILAVPLLPLALPLGLSPATALGDGISAERARQLERLVLQDCGSCHGLTRKGGLGSPLTTEALEGAAADGLAAIILDGVPGTAMPPWRPLLTEADAVWIARYLLEEPSQ